jgi:hypothetical protein
MDKLVDDGYTMNANSAGGHLGLSAPCCSTPRFLDRPATHSR